MTQVERRIFSLHLVSAFAPCVLAVAVLLGGAGCGPTDTQANSAAGAEASRAKTESTKSTAATVETLRARAQTLWSARVKDDWNSVFEFLPRLLREASSPAQFNEWCQTEEPFSFSAFDIESVEVDGKIGWVWVRNKVAMRKMRGDIPRDQLSIERWVLEDGTVWIPVPRDQIDLYPEPPSKRNTSEEARLRDRIEAAVKMRMNADLAALYAVVEPADRELVEYEIFERNFDAVLILDHEIEWIEVLDNRGRIRSKYLQRPNDPNLSKLRPEWHDIIERWILVDGVWYLDLTDYRAPRNRSSST